jgi:hypothetical protein
MNPAGQVAPETLLDELAEGADSAAGATEGYQDRYFEIAGLVARLRFAGPALAGPLTRALAHLEVAPSDQPALEVRLWDSSSTSSPPPLRPEGVAVDTEWGSARISRDGEQTAFVQWGPGSLDAIDLVGGQAFCWCEDGGALEIWILGAPLLTPLHLWLASHGLLLIHAAAVGNSDGCVVLGGSSGAGKSSAALSCLGSDLSVLADDYCLVRPGDPPVVHSLYCSAKAEESTLERLPELRDLVVPTPPNEEGKALLDLSAAGPKRMLASAPLSAVALPQVSPGNATTAVPCSPGTALAATAPSTMLQLSGTTAETMQRLRATIGAVPSYRLEVGSDPALIPEAIEEMLEWS